MRVQLGWHQNGNKPGNCRNVLRLTVMLDYLVCASAGEEVELNKRVMSLEFGMAVMQMTSVL